MIECGSFRTYSEEREEGNGCGVREGSRDDVMLINNVCLTSANDAVTTTLFSHLISSQEHPARSSN